MKEKKILIIEDDRDYRRIICDYLTENEYVVLEAETGEQAHEIAVKHTPDVILLDVVLPGKNGVSLCREFKADDRLYSIPIIMISGIDRLHDKLHGYLAGARAWLSKPCDLDDVGNCIRRALGLSIEPQILVDEPEQRALQPQQALSMELDSPENYEEEIK